jgi:hypothetical protein
MYKFLTVMLIVYIAFSTCKKKEELPLSIIDDPKIPDEVYLIELSKKILLLNYKEAKVEKTKDGNFLVLEYGGSSALSFRDQDTYQKEMKLITANYLLKFIRYTKSRNLKLITISLVKPYYVNEESIKREVIEEFEVYRVSLEIESTKNIKDIDIIDLENVNTKSPEWESKLKVLEEIIKLWRVELNDLRRIEVK